jgi:iron complex outermembrane receptor protein
MDTSRIVLRRTKAALTVGCAFLSFVTGAPLFGQADTEAESTAYPLRDEPIKLDRFVATGSRFNDRTIVDSPVPIDVVTNAEMRQGGYTETSQVLQALVPSFNFPRPTVADGSDHIRPATLRGLAPDQVLVLINGKRRHTSSLVNVNNSIGRGSVSVDLNALPPTSIGQVEVLRDGAAAQYGSDAIAGVINIFLRRDAGYELTTTVGKTYEGDGALIETAFDAGAPLASTGFLHASTYFRHRDQTNRTGRDVRQQYFVTRNGAPAIASVVSGTNNTPVYLPTDVLDPRETTFDRHSAQQGDSDSKEYGLVINSDAPLAKNVEAYAFGGYTKRDGRAAANFRRALDNSNVRSIFPNGFLPFIETKIVDASVTGGVKGKATGWGYDLSQTWGSNELRYDVDNTVNGSLGNASPTHFYAGKLFFQQATTNLDLTRDYDFGWHAPLRTALGAEYRWENYRITAGEPDSYRDGHVRIFDGPNANSATTLPAPGAQGFPGYQPADEADPKRHSYAVYTDFETDLTDQLLVSLAGRYENYSDFGSTFNGKLALRFQIIKPLAIRASVGTGFRAPSLAQGFFSSTATNFINGVPFEIRTFPVSNPVARALGATDLKPEKSRNASIGATTQFGDVFTASVDFYQINIDDRVVYSSNFNDAGTLAFLRAQGFPGVGGARFFTNAVDSRTRGVDLTGRYMVKFDNGSRLTLTGGINYNQQKFTRIAGTPPQLAAVSTIPLIDRIEVTRYEKGQPRNTFNFSADYAVKGFTFLVREVRYGQVATTAVNTDFSRDQVFGAKWLTDADVGYRFNKHLSVNVGANNLFDVKPDKIIPPNNPSGFLKYSLISPFGMNGGFYYVRTDYKF